MRPRALCPALLLLFVPLLATTAAAQTSATISGTVNDPNRAVLPGVTVTVRNVGTSLSRTVATNAEGRLRHRRAGAGRLRAARRALQLQALRARDLQLTISQALVVNITLEVGGLSEEVTVAGDTSLVNTSTPSSATWSGRKRSISCRSTAATTRISRCCSPACSPIRTATAARSRTGSP